MPTPIKQDVPFVFSGTLQISAELDPKVDINNQKIEFVLNQQPQSSTATPAATTEKLPRKVRVFATFCIILMAALLFSILVFNWPPADMFSKKPAEKNKQEQVQPQPDDEQKALQEIG